MSCKVLAVVNQKGGVGKTTTAINIASYLSEFGNKVLLIDLDSQSNATSGLGLRPDTIQAGIYDLLISEAPISTVLYPTPFDKLHIIPSTKDLAGAEVELVGFDSRETVLRDRISGLRSYYDYVVMDCPPSLGLITLNALVAADRTLIPVQCEYFALEGIASLLNTLGLVKEMFNPGLEISGIVLTMYDKRTALNRQVAENVRTYFKDLIYETIIPRNVRLSEAPSHGLPISLYKSDSRGAIAYLNLAREVNRRD
ncbi:ParA family protein [bacterium]|nr:ParA family protein [bacterium]